MDDNNNNKLISYKQKQQSQITQQPRDILEEDEYTSTLSHIVTRDYFPSLHSLRRDAAILDARSRGDISSAVAVRRMHRKDEIQREREWKEEMEVESKAIQEEDNKETSVMPYINHQSNKIQVRSKPRPLKHETITGFHARVTSEDNAEYESIQEEERMDREKRLGIIYSTKEGKEGRLMIEAAMNNTTKKEVVNPYNKASRALMGYDTPIGLSSDLYDAPATGLRITQGSSANDDEEDRKKIAAKNGIGRNGLFFQPLHRRLENNPTNTGQLMLALDGATTSSSSGGTFLALENNANRASSKEDDNNKTDNLLMPPPPARQSSVMVKHGSSIQPPSAIKPKTIDDRCQLVEYLPKPTVPDIYPRATRFPYQNESRLLAKTNNSLGHAYNRQSSIQSMGSFTEASDTTDLDASPRSLERERAARQKARKRENETFIAMTPLIRPGEGRSISKIQGGEQSASEEPIMTWGNVANTPLVLSNSAVDGRDASAEWEPTRPIDSNSFSSGNDAGSESTPAFDVVDDNRREKLARRAEKKLIERSKTYKGRRRKDDTDDNQSVMSSRSASSIASGTSFKRRESLTPAARALLEASNNAHQSKKQRKLGSMFQASARSRDSFGSSLRMSYTPNRDGDSMSRKRKSSSSSVSSMRRAAGGATPRCNPLK